MNISYEENQGLKLYLETRDYVKMLEKEPYGRILYLFNWMLETFSQDENRFAEWVRDSRYKDVSKNMKKLIKAAEEIQ